MFGSKRRAAARREQLLAELRDLIERAERRKLSYDQLRQLRKFSDGFYPIEVGGKQYSSSDAYYLAQAAGSMADDRQRLKMAHEELGRAENREQQIFRLAEVINAYGQADWLNMSLLEAEFGSSVKRLQARLRRLVRRHYDELLEQRREGPSQFERLRHFIGESRRGDHSAYYGSSGLKPAGVKPLPYPDDYNELIARFYKNPTVSLFLLPRRGLNSTEVARLAEATVREQDATLAFTNAKIVLAYCMDTNFRIQVGDPLYTQLLEIVNTHHPAEVSAETE